jgi:hypothetical protein
LWFLAAVVLVVGDDRGPFAATQTLEITSPTNRIYKVAGPRSMSKDGIVDSINDAAAIEGDTFARFAYPISIPICAQMDAWLASHPSIGFHSDGGEFLFLGLILALVVWLFGRACLYVLAD